MNIDDSSDTIISKQEGKRGDLRARALRERSE